MADLHLKIFTAIADGEEKKQLQRYEYFLFLLFMFSVKVKFTFALLAQVYLSTVLPKF